jgi:hypothetical protein
VWKPTEQQQIIIDQLGTDAISIDALIDRTGLDVSILMRELTFLSIKGAVQRVDGRNYELARYPRRFGPELCARLRRDWFCVAGNRDHSHR